MIQGVVGVLTEEERQKVLMEVERQQTEFGTEK
jgi:beta-galactosidase